MEIRPVGAELFIADGRTDREEYRQTDGREEYNSLFSQLCTKRLKCGLCKKCIGCCDIPPEERKTVNLR